MSKQINPWAIPNKQAIIEKFSPKFCFHKNEYIFPTDVESYAKDVLTAKMKHYKLKFPGELTEEEKLAATENEELTAARVEYKLIKDCFFAGGDENTDGFNILGFGHQQVIDYLEVELDHKKDNNKPTHHVDPLLTFNEKKLGYKLEEKVPIGGHKPDEVSNEINCSVYVSYLPTSQGAIIRYECFYAASGAIYGTDKLYEMLPAKINEKVDNFAFHAGDWEGVFIEVLINEKGVATIDHMQTFAHGRSGARKVQIDELDFQGTHPCVYVGCSTHPSYTDNFWFRNKFADIVGDKYSLIAKEFIDLSPDPQIIKPVWVNCAIWGEPWLMTQSNAIANEDDYRSSQTKDNWLIYDYHPISETWKKISCCVPKIKLLPKLILENFEIIVQENQVNPINTASSSVLSETASVYDMASPGSSSDVETVSTILGKNTESLGQHDSVFSDHG